VIERLVPGATDRIGKAGRNQTATAGSRRPPHARALRRAGAGGAAGALAQCGSPRSPRLAVGRSCRSGNPLQAPDQNHDPSPGFHPHCLWIRCLGILCMKRSVQFGRCILEGGVHERPLEGTFTPSLNAQSPGLGDRIVLLVRSLLHVVDRFSSRVDDFIPYLPWLRPDLESGEDGRPLR
jgi:hypothetical protein